MNVKKQSSLFQKVNYQQSIRPSKYIFYYIFLPRQYKFNINSINWRKLCLFKDIIFFFETKQYFQAMCFKTTLNRIAKAALDVRGKQCEIYAIYL